MTLDPSTPIEFTVDIRGLGVVAWADATLVGGIDLDARNTADSPSRVVPRPTEALRTESTVTVVLPPASWMMLRVRREPDAA